jgi:hypothetical protein
MKFRTQEFCVENKGTERKQRGQNKANGGFPTPPTLDGRAYAHEKVEEEKDSVDEADYPDGLGLAGGILERHGDSKEQDKRQSLEKSHNSQAANLVAEKRKHSARCNSSGGVWQVSP